MKKKCCFFLYLALFIALLPGSAPALAQTALDTNLDTLAARIVEVMVKNAGPNSGVEKNPIAILDFLDLKGNVTSLGRFVAEELTTRLVLTKRFDVIERQLLNKVLAELKLSASGLVDSSSAQELGSILGVSAVVSGTLSELTSTVRVNARVIATTTGRIVAAASIELPKDESIAQLLATVIVPADGFLPATGPDLSVISGQPSAQPLNGNTEEIPSFQQENYKFRIEQALKSHNYLKVFSLCQEALAMDPDFAFAHAVMGYTHLQIRPPNEEQALLALGKAVTLYEYPFENGFAHYLLGCLYDGQGRHPDARLALEKAALRYQVVGPVRSTDTWYDQAIQRCLEIYQEEIKGCWERQDYRRALFLSQQVIESFNPAFAYTAKGYSLLKIDLRQAPEAVSSFLRALQLSTDPTGDGWTYYLLGWAYREVGEEEKAREALEEAVTRTRQVLSLTPPVWYDDCLYHLQAIYSEKSETLLTKERYEEAIAFLTGALDFLPGATDLYVALGYTYLMTGKDPDRAIEVLEEAHQRETEPTEPGWSHYLLGWAYQERERYGSAVEALSEALRRGMEPKVASPEWAPACRRRLEESYTQLFALFRNRGGNNSYYLMLAEESIALLPEFPVGYGIKAYCLTELSSQRYEEALAALKQAQALKEDPTGDGWIYYAWGRFYEQRGEKQLALEYLEKALQRGAEQKLDPRRNYWYRQCDTLVKKLSKQKRQTFGLSVNLDSRADEPHFLFELGGEKGRPFQSFSGFKVRVGASSKAWWGVVGGELAWEGEVFPPTESVGWYALLGGGIYGLYELPEANRRFDYGFYFAFGAGLRLYLGKTNSFYLAVGSDCRYYLHKGNALSFGVALGLPSQ